MQGVALAPRHIYKGDRTGVVVGNRSNPQNALTHFEDFLRHRHEATVF
jgi:hypothetical protein